MSRDVKHTGQLYSIFTQTGLKDPENVGPLDETFNLHPDGGPTFGGTWMIKNWRNSKIPSSASPAYYISLLLLYNCRLIFEFAPTFAMSFTKKESTKKTNLPHHCN